MRNKTFYFSNILILFVFSLLFASCDDEKRIDIDKLPTKAQQFISSNFPGISITQIIQDKDDGRKEYDVILSDGSTVQFDENGDWSEPELSTDLEGHAKIADIQEENASKRTAATIDAIGASTQAVTSTINANAQNNIRLSVKQHGQVMNALNNSLSVQTAQLKMRSMSLSIIINYSPFFSQSMGRTTNFRLGL